MRDCTRITQIHVLHDFIILPERRSIETKWHAFLHHEHRNFVRTPIAGEIPPELGNLSALVSLWLNDNQFEGKHTTGQVTFHIRRGRMRGAKSVAFPTFAWDVLGRIQHLPVASRRTFEELQRKCKVPSRSKGPIKACTYIAWHVFMRFGRNIVSAFFKKVCARH